MITVVIEGRPLEEIGMDEIELYVDGQWVQLTGIVVMPGPDETTMDALARTLSMFPTRLRNPLHKHTEAELDFIKATLRLMNENAERNRADLLAELNAMHRGDKPLH